MENGGDLKISKSNNNGILTDMRDFRRLFTPGVSIGVFAYADLMWEPRFEYTSKFRAAVGGYQRSLCLYSSAEKSNPPALMFGMDRGSRCEGIVYRLASAELDDLARIWQTEENPGAYVPVKLNIEAIEAAFQNEEIFAFVADPMFSGQPNEAYIRHVYDTIERLRLHDPELQFFMEMLDAGNWQNYWREFESRHLIKTTGESVSARDEMLIPII
ncbi:hypothetical protein CHS0354_006850 [Potamilus streckersoni]|uniref:glutathione-specific gamma-glutamylcyclotransferase n=1 Tax=Potamilus streckersoni TaxID=2493646 RepID=A0AAE0TF30_9BIVA|nr:hypothetical protein CHS0354_006850 [Potamilus streckersoni]